MEFFTRHWGDVASLLGCALTILTIWFARRAKTAAEQARAAAEEVRDRISRFDTVSELSAAITIIEEISRLQRTQAWEIIWDIVLDRHSALRRHLVGSQAGIGSAALQSRIGAAIVQLDIMVENIESARTKPQRSKLNTAAFNRSLADQLGVLVEVRTNVKAGV